MLKFSQLYEGLIQQKDGNYKKNKKIQNECTCTPKKERKKKLSKPLWVVGTHPVKV